MDLKKVIDTLEMYRVTSRKCIEYPASYQKWLDGTGQSQGQM